MKTSRFGLMAVLMIGCALATTSFAQSPGWSRGQQLISTSYDDCVRRAASALQAEGYQVEYAAGAFAVGRKAVHTGVIMCNAAPDGKQWVNVVVSSNGDGGGAERQRLQDQMNGSPTAPPPPPPPPPPPNATAINWYTTTKDHLDARDGERFSYSCPPYPGETLSIWGTEVYTFDSGICLAGVHVGVITRERGGTVTVEMRPGQALYPATVRNGISSQGYGAYNRSFAVVTGAASSISKVGATSTSPLGEVWLESEAGNSGTWTRRPGTNVFDGFWSGAGVRAVLQISISGNRVAVRRSEGTDGYVCDYTGTISGNEASGTFGCNKNPGPIAWRATIQR